MEVFLVSHQAFIIHPDGYRRVRPALRNDFFHSFVCQIGDTRVAIWIGSLRVANA